jgi:hypothetical protein
MPPVQSSLAGNKRMGPDVDEADTELAEQIRWVQDEARRLMEVRQAAMSKAKDEQLNLTSKRPSKRLYTEAQLQKAHQLLRQRNQVLLELDALQQTETHSREEIERLRTRLNGLSFASIHRATTSILNGHPNGVPEKTIANWWNHGKWASERTPTSGTDGRYLNDQEEQQLVLRIIEHQLWNESLEKRDIVSIVNETLKAKQEMGMLANQRFNPIVSHVVAAYAAAAVPTKVNPCRASTCVIQEGVKDHWLTDFMKRNNLKSIHSKAQETLRAKSINSKTIITFQVAVQKLWKKFPSVAMLLDFDEVGFHGADMKGKATGRFEVGISDIDASIAPQSDFREHFTGLVTITDEKASCVLPPGLIIKGTGDNDHRPKGTTLDQAKRQYQQFQSTTPSAAWRSADNAHKPIHDFEKWLWVSESGNNNSAIMGQYFDQSIDWIKNIPRAENAWVVWIMDGASSHWLKKEQVDAALEHKVAVIILPSHTTGVLQPADVAFFDRLKMEWRRLIKLVYARHRTPLTKHNYIYLFLKAVDACANDTEYVPGARTPAAQTVDAFAKAGWSRSMANAMSFADAVGQARLHQGDRLVEQARRRAIRIKMQVDKATAVRNQVLAQANQRTKTAHVVLEKALVIHQRLTEEQKEAAIEDLPQTQLVLDKNGKPDSRLGSFLGMGSLDADLQERQKQTQAKKHKAASSKKSKQDAAAHSIETVVLTPHLMYKKKKTEVQEWIQAQLVSPVFATKPLDSQRALDSINTPAILRRKSMEELYGAVCKYLGVEFTEEHKNKELRERQEEARRSQQEVMNAAAAAAAGAGAGAAAAVAAAPVQEPVDAMDVDVDGNEGKGMPDSGEGGGGGQATTTKPPTCPERRR